LFCHPAKRKANITCPNLALFIQIIKHFFLLEYRINSTSTDFKTSKNQAESPPGPKGCRLFFLLSPFMVRSKKSEKADKKLICQSSIENLIKIISCFYNYHYLVSGCEVESCSVAFIL